MNIIWSDTATGLSALIAAAAGLANLYLLLRDRSERLFIREGSTVPSIDHYTSFYVVNKGKDAVNIRDYGFVLHSSELFSIPYKIECAEPGDELDVYSFKSLVLPPLGHVQAGMDIPGHVAGFYVLSTTRERPVVSFARDLPFYQQYLLRLKLLRQLKYA